jgi:multiple sugar transport system permease protein
MAANADTHGRRRVRAASSLFDEHIRWVLVAPAVLLILFMTIYPLGYSMWVNFVNYDFAIPGHRWVALDNFKTVWDDPIARHALWVTLGLSVACVAVELVLGFLLALAMLRAFVGRRVLMVLFVVPLFMSPVIIGSFFALILTRPYGPTNYLLGKLLGHAINIDFTNDHPWYYISIVLADAWQWTPFMFVILLAGLASISDQLYEAAEIDGATPRQSFFFVTLPLLAPIVLLAVTFRLIDSMKLFDVIYVLTKGGPGTSTYTLSYYLYEQGFQLFHLGDGTAGSWMFVVLISVIAFWLVRRLLKPVEVAGT